MAISMLKIRRPLGRLIFNMGIAIPGKTVFLIETAPWVWFHIVLRLLLDDLQCYIQNIFWAFNAIFLFVFCFIYFEVEWVGNLSSLIFVDLVGNICLFVCYISQHQQYRKKLVCWIKFHSSLHWMVQVTIQKHWFSWWLGAEEAPSHYLN